MSTHQRHFIQNSNGIVKSNFENRVDRGRRDLRGIMGTYVEWDHEYYDEPVILNPQLERYKAGLDQLEYNGVERVEEAIFASLRNLDQQELVGRGRLHRIRDAHLLATVATYVDGKQRDKDKPDDEKDRRRSKFLRALRDIGKKCDATLAMKSPEAQGLQKHSEVEVPSINKKTRIDFSHLRADLEDILSPYPTEIKDRARERFLQMPKSGNFLETTTIDGETVMITKDNNDGIQRPKSIREKARSRIVYPTTTLVTATLMESSVTLSLHGLGRATFWSPGSLCVYAIMLVVAAMGGVFLSAIVDSMRRKDMIEEGDLAWAIATNQKHVASGQAYTHEQASIMHRPKFQETIVDYTNILRDEMISAICEAVQTYRLEQDAGVFE